MAKLGKKARKFARKNLPSLLRNRRKFKSRLNSFKRRSSSAAAAAAEDGSVPNTKISAAQNAVKDIPVNGVAGNSFFDSIFGEHEDCAVEDLSGSDGYLSEDPDCPYISESEDGDVGDKKCEGKVSSMAQNTATYLELYNRKEKLDKLKKKDPDFAEFLKMHQYANEKLKNEEPYSDEDDSSDMSLDSNDGLMPQKWKTITKHTVDVWCWLTMEEESTIALASLLNGYRTASHYWVDGAEGSLDLMIFNREVFSKILMFMLSEADGIFLKILGISNSFSKESILKVKNNPKWRTTRPMIKSYLRSTLFLLDQLTDGQIIAYVLNRLRASITFFVAFPSLTARLIKAIVHLWATGDETLSLLSFLVLKDLCMQQVSECYESCLTRMYRSYMGCCNFIELTNMTHIGFLRDSLVQLYSLEVQRSFPKVLGFLQQLTSILQQSLKTMQKEELKKICSWQYAKSLEIWVQYISDNIKEHDMQPLLHLVIQIIGAMTYQLPGTRYLPLRLRYIRLLNRLSSSSGVFIPITYLLLDIFHTKGSGNSDKRPEKNISLFSTLKAPKQWLKSRNFQEECIVCALELLSEHFSQWSYHVSFPDLAAIPLIILKRYHDNIAIESIRRPLKRFIDQAHANCELVQRKRDEVSFSPNDQASVDAFLMMNTSGNTPFTLYYNTVREKSASRV